MDNTLEDRLTLNIKTLDWQITDAKNRLQSAAHKMQRRAAEAITQTDALVADQPCGQSWVDFAEGDLREAREAKAELERLIGLQKTLKFILK